MAKTKEELDQLKNEYESLSEKLKELSDDELMFVAGGAYRKEPGSDKNAKVIFDVD